MPRKKTPGDSSKKAAPNVFGLRADVLEQPITDTLQSNFMPYAMSVIVSRAIPEIDGFKPSQRKLLFTMFKMGLLSGSRTKSANIVGQTMRLNPHGEGAIYETMVRLSKGYEALLAPFVDSKGSFGKIYSRDMAYAASRYTEAKLAPICNELFRDIDKNTVDFVPNYDGSLLEPLLLPTSFPNLLVSSNQGIAVGMASMICGFNLSEVCETTIAFLNNPNCSLLDTLLAPDFPTGAELIFDRELIDSIYRTGRGSFKLRATWRFDPKNNIIEINEIPYTTTAEAIIDKVADLIKAGKIREISDMRDETDLNGLKLAIDLKRGTDPDKLMQKLFKLTPLMDSFSCNFNVLVAGSPRVMGIHDILAEWSRWRISSVRRRISFDLSKKSEKLHLLNGLAKILLDIDKAISIIRNTDSDADVVPNLMIGFGIDSPQADFVAEIRLRNINKEYILNRIQEISQLEKDIADLDDISKNESRIKKIIIDELKAVIKKFGAPRKTRIISGADIEEYKALDDIDDYPVTLFLSKHGYFKKITPISLRMSGEQKFKENDSLRLSFDTTNRADLLIFTDKFQTYKVKASDFDDSKASALGDYLPSRLEMDDAESVIFLADAGLFDTSILFIFENGKAARVPLSAYATKTNRKKLSNAYSDRSPLRAIIPFSDDTDIALYSSDNRALIFNTSLLAPKSSRDSHGVSVMSLKPKARLTFAAPLDSTPISNFSRYRVRGIPAAGASLKPEDSGDFISPIEI